MTADAKVSFHIHDRVSSNAGPVEVAALSFAKEGDLVSLALGERGIKIWQSGLDAQFRAGRTVAVSVTLTPAAGGEVHHNLDRAIDWFDRLEHACAKSDHALIHVGGAGGGPTDKSRKVRLLAWEKLQRTDVRHAPATEHTLTVPVSLVQELDGKSWMPRWAARRTANQRLQKPGRHQVRFEVDGLGGQCRVPPDVKSGIDALRQTLCGALENALAVARKVQGEASARRAAEQAAWEAGAPARVQRALEAAAAQAERERKAAKAAAAAKANRERLPTVTGAHVAWVDWVGRNMKAVLREADGCTVRTSGQRVYITLPSGAEVIKTRQTVQVNDEQLPAQHSVQKARERLLGAMPSKR